MLLHHCYPHGKVTTLCRAQLQVSDTNNYRPLQAVNGCYDCPCQFTPPLNAFTYCVLKKICKKIFKEICQEQNREVFTIFDGGPCSKYESLIKDNTQRSKNETQSIRCKDKLQNQNENRPSTVESIDSQTKTKRSLTQSESKTKKNGANSSVQDIKKTKKEEKGKRSERKDQDGGSKHEAHEEVSERNREKTKGKDRNKEKANENDKNKETDERGKDRRHSKMERINASKTEAAKEKIEQEKSESHKTVPNGVEKQNTESTTTRSLRQIEKTPKDSLMLRMNKSSRFSGRRSQSACDKVSRSLLGNRLDIDRDFSKRHDTCKERNGQCERFEQIIITCNPCRSHCGPSRIDSIKPCDYLRADMEYKEMCCQRVLPSCDRCLNREHCFVPEQYAQMPTNPCGSCPISYVQCAV